MSTTRTFTREELDDLGLPYGWRKDRVTIISQEMVDKRRWYITTACTFRLPEQPEDEAWVVYYNDPSTECQDSQDIWNDEDDVTATLVRKVTKTLEVWEPANKETT